VFGGVVADRYDRRYLLMLLDGLRGVLMFALAVVIAVDGPSVVVLGVVFVVCSLGTPYRPALSSGYPLLLPERDLVAANALRGTVGQVTALWVRYWVHCCWQWVHPRGRSSPMAARTSFQSCCSPEFADSVAAVAMTRRNTTPLRGWGN